MTRRAAKVTHSEMVRIIKGVQACGLAISRVSFDGERLEIVVGGGGKTGSSAPARSPATFKTLEEYEAWRATRGEPSDEPTFQSWDEYEAWRETLPDRRSGGK